MDEDYPEWKPNQVKLESELILDDDIETDTNFTAADLDASITEPILSVTQDETNLAMKIKEEVTEDIIPSADSFLDGDDKNTTKMAPVSYRKEDFVFPQEKISIKKEDNFIEENNTNNNHSSLDFTEVNKEMRVKENGAVKQPHAASAVSVCSNSSIKRTLQDYTDAASNENQVSAKHRKAQFTSSTAVRKCVPFQSDWIPFEFVDVSAAIKKEVVTDLDVCVDENTTSARSARIFPSTSSSTECSTVSCEKNLSCKQCAAQFKQKACLDSHLLLHSSERVFSCDQCSARFKRNCDLEIHLLSHSDERAFSCDECSARFKHKYSLQTHLLRHSDKREFSCDQCSARFNARGHLRKHSLIHSSDRPFSCEQCSARFKTKISLEKHYC